MMRYEKVGEKLRETALMVIMIIVMVMQQGPYNPEEAAVFVKNAP